MAPVVSMFRIIFCAVPAFMRVEPATTSAPTSATMATCARVFVGFYGCAQRFWAAGDDELPDARADVKGGWAFDGVEGGNASAGAGADVDEAPALRERRGDQIDCLRDLPQSLLHGTSDLGIFAVDDAGDFKRRFTIQIGRGEVCFLGPEAAEFRGLCFARQRLSFQVCIPNSSC